jgi:outer membrane protein TolC
VRAAERALAAATAQIGVAQAALYPNFAFSGNINARANTVGSLLDTVTGGLFAGLTQAIFNGGRLRSQVRGQEAAADAALAAYKGTVLTALEDVENAVVALDTADRRERELAVAFDAAGNAALLSREQYRSGLSDFTTLSQQEATLLTTRNSAAQARADEATALVQLFAALGGGWDSTTVPTAPPRVAPPPTLAQPAPTPASTNGNP